MYLNHVLLQFHFSTKTYDTHLGDKIKNPCYTTVFLYVIVTEKMRNAWLKTQVQTI